MSIPQWQQQQPCPPWCTAVHVEDDHPDDHSHRDDGIFVPVMFRKRHFESQALVERVVAGHIALGRLQRDGESHVWRFIGTDDGLEIEISEESFAYLVDEMRRMMN